MESCSRWSAISQAATAFALLLALSLTGSAFGAEITVSAAASLTNALTEIQKSFQAAHTDITVFTNFAASNPLLEQMRQGAPVDVFASADQVTMDKAAEAELIDPSTRRNFVTNTLVLIVPKGQTIIKGVDDLHLAKRIAIGNPDSVPAGRYARDAFISMGVWDKLYPALVQGESVRQVTDYVSRGEVDAGAVYATYAFQYKDSVDIVATLTGHAPILYPVAVATAARDKTAAQAFVDFLFSTPGITILTRFGFTPVIADSR